MSGDVKTSRETIATKSNFTPNVGTPIVMLKQIKTVEIVYGRIIVTTNMASLFIDGRLNSPAQYTHDIFLYNFLSAVYIYKTQQNRLYVSASSVC